ncbi:NfeD family protein [Agaribacterium haliotis]|uniref:NfeD family protein n=1 Tax=Agaribacterium haliotis TaxID=2013869 RepID=UPI000BB54542|nr:NfeD family protein [Agaribacterium haliotis]
MFEQLQSIPSWLWLSLGLVLLVVEMLGLGGFLLGTGVAALCMAVLSWFSSLHWTVEVPLFATLSVLFSYIYIKHMKPNALESEDPKLNNRMARLIGKQTALTKATEHGVGKVQIQDAFWTVKCEQDLAAGTKVKVLAYEGSTLIVEACDESL